MSSMDDLIARIMDVKMELGEALQALADGERKKNLALEARKKSLELEKLMKKFRKVSVQEVG